MVVVMALMVVVLTDGDGGSHGGSHGDCHRGMKVLGGVTFMLMVVMMVIAVLTAVEVTIADG